MDGFYAAVVQNLRPSSARAPQLPKGAQTAAEEAGIDVTPPPGDLLEDADASIPESGVADRQQATSISSAVDRIELAEPDPAAPGAEVANRYRSRERRAAELGRSASPAGSRTSTR